MNAIEAALAFISTLLGLYLLLVIIRTYVLCFSALRYDKLLARAPVNKELLARRPFVSILIPTYNEENVIERLMKAVTSLDYEPYEVIVIDDSTDRTMEILRRWAEHPRVKVIHRERREGWKGGALNEGLKHLDPRSEFVLIFDADFIPPKDVIQRLLARFVNDKIAAVQGYHLAILNAAENWITRAARTVLAMGYAIDYAGRFALGGAPQLGGSVMMIRRDVLEEVGGFSTSITEDYDLALRLYERGYEIFYDASVKVPCECPSTFKHFVRQTCRWIEGRTRDFRKHLWSLLSSKNVSLRKKLDIMLDGISNFAGPAFLILMICQVISIATHTHFPGFLELLQLPWPIQLAYSIFTSACVPLSTMLALKREGERRTRDWMICFMLAAYMATPFYFKACLKGVFAESTYFYRTYKTGRILLQEQVGRLLLPTGALASPPYAGHQGLFSFHIIGELAELFSYHNWPL